MRIALRRMAAFFAVSILALLPVMPALCNGINTPEERAAARTVTGFFDAALKPQGRPGPFVQFPLGFVDGFSGKYRVYPSGNNRWTADLQGRLPRPAAGERFEVIIEHIQVEDGSASVMFTVYLSRETIQKKIATGAALLVKAENEEWRITSFSVGRKSERGPARASRA